MVQFAGRFAAVWATFVACDSTTAPPTPFGPSADFSIAAIDFGAASCGGAAPSNQTLTIRNAAPHGATNLTYSVSVTDDKAFSIVSGNVGTLAAGESADIVVAAASVPTTATAGQSIEAALLVDTNDSLHSAQFVPLKVTAHGATFTMTPAAYDFGDVPIDYFGATTPITLTNVGNEPGTISFVQPTSPSMLIEWPLAPTSPIVAPGASLSGLLAKFGPSQPGSVIDTATLKVDGAACGALPLPLQLKGRGVGGVVGVSPGTLDFGLVPCGTTALPQAVVVFNTGNAPFHVNAALDLYAPYGISTNYAIVPANGAVTIMVTPTAIPQYVATTPNLFGSHLTITTDVLNDAPHVVQLEETASGGNITASSNPLAFDKQLVGAQAKKSITFTNNGNAKVDLQMSTTGAFSVPSTTTVPANGSATVDVGYWPDPRTLGIQASGTIELSTQSPMCSQLGSSVQLTATAVDQATTVAVGGHVCATAVSGYDYCWGENTYGQLGDGTTTARSTPYPTSTSYAGALTVGGSSTCANFGSGVECWGNNGYGQLGNGWTYDSIMPVVAYNAGPSQRVVAGNISFCSLRTGGDVMCWGYDADGHFGTGSQSSPVTSATSAFGGLTDVVDVSVGSGAACIVRNDGSVECAGSNWIGQLGNGTTTDSSLPVVVSNISSATAVATSGYTSCALQSTGHVSCWGQGGAGALGNGTNTSAALTPVTVSNLSDAISISTGSPSGAICALRSTGDVVCWGDNSNGELGNGTWTNSNTPVTVSNLSNVTSLAVGPEFACAIHGNGKLACWGTGVMGNGAFHALTATDVYGFN